MAPKIQDSTKNPNSFILAPDSIIADQIKAALWLRINLLTSVWFPGEVAWANVRLSNLVLALSPWSLLAFRNERQLFVAITSVLGTALTEILVMNQLQFNSIQYTLSSVLYAIQEDFEENDISSQGAMSPPLSVSCLGSSESPLFRDLPEWNHLVFDASDIPLRLRIPDFRVDNEAFQVAMDITEQLGLLTNASGPVPTDMPIQSIPLARETISCFHSWLQTLYDWDEDVNSLVAPNRTAESLAQAILGQSACHRSLVTESSPVTLTEIGGSQFVDITTMFAGSITGGMFLDEHHIALDDVPAITSAESTITGPSTKQKRGRLVPRTNISIVVHRDKQLDSIQILSSPDFPPPPAPVSMAITPVTKYLEREVELDIGMASYETWNGGRKAGVLAGLFAIGAAFSPLSSSSFGGSVPAALRDLRSPSRSSQRSILSPWLDVVRIDGFDPIQSPWIADSAVIDAFPQSPRFF